MHHLNRKLHSEKTDRAPLSLQLLHTNCTCRPVHKNVIIKVNKKVSRHGSNIQPLFYFITKHHVVQCKQRLLDNVRGAKREIDLVSPERIDPTVASYCQHFLSHSIIVNGI